MKHFRLLPLLSVAFLCGCSHRPHYPYEYWGIKYEEFEKEVKNAKNCDCSFVGDSITDWYPLSTYYPGCNYVNRGISGDTTTGVYDRLDVCVYDINPKCVYLMIGTNNIHTCLENYEDILSGIKKECPKTKVMVASILPRTGKDFCQKIIEVNQVIQELTVKYEYFYLDLYTPMRMPEDGLLVNDSLFGDGLHPNAEGYQVMTDLIAPILTSWLAN